MKFTIEPEQDPQAPLGKVYYVHCLATDGQYESLWEHTEEFTNEMDAARFKRECEQAEFLDLADWIEIEPNYYDIIPN